MLNTASGLIEYYTKYEDRIKSFYETLAEDERCAADKELFKSMAKENEKHKKEVLRAYYEVITDAIEACYIRPLDETKYEVDTEITPEMTYADILRKAVDIEEKSGGFCAEAYRCTSGLLADISVAFRRVSRWKAKRAEKLKELLESVR